MHLTRAGIGFRIGLFVLAFGIGIAAFQMGAGVSNRDGVGAGNLMADIYYALGLFVLGGLDLGVPSSGPPLAQTLLWIAYFLAPTITTGAVIEGALQLFRPRTLARWGLRDHIVIVGVGRLGMLYLEALREVEPRRKVVMVDLNVDGANAAMARERFGASVLAGDISRRETRDALKLDGAVGVVVLTSDDLTNLEAAWDIVEEHPDRDFTVVAHVAEIGTRRRADQLLEQGGQSRIVLFNSHEAAALGLYREHFELLREMPGESVIVLAGFGRFGQTIFAHLEREFAMQHEIHRVVIIDTDASLLFKVFRQQVGMTRMGRTLPHAIIEGNMADPELWTALEADLPTEHDRVYVLGSDDDWLNIRTAIMLRTAHLATESAQVLVRCFHDSDFITDMSERLGLGLSLLPVEKKMRSVLARHHREWFGESTGLLPRMSPTPGEGPSDGDATGQAID